MLHTPSGVRLYRVMLPISRDKKTWIMDLLNLHVDTKLRQDESCSSMTDILKVKEQASSDVSIHTWEGVLSRNWSRELWIRRVCKLCSMSRPTCFVYPRHWNIGIFTFRICTFGPLLYMPFGAKQVFAARFSVHFLSSWRATGFISNDKIQTFLFEWNFCCSTKYLHTKIMQY